MVSIAIAAVVSVAVPAVNAQSPPAEALFVQASVDDERPYLGQQITYSLRIYQKQDADLSFLSVSSYTPPRTSSVSGTARSTYSTSTRIR